MNQDEALAGFFKKTREEIQKIYEQIKKESADGYTSLVYYPASESLLKQVIKDLKAENYWVREIQDTRWVELSKVKEWQKAGKTFCYYRCTDIHGDRFYLKGIKIWWKRPGFWEYNF